MGGGRQEADVRRMSPVHVGMPDTTADGEVGAEVAKHLQVGRGYVITPGLACVREELVRKHSQVVAYAKKPPRHNGFGVCMSKGRQHRIEERQSKQDAGPAQKMTTGERVRCRDLDRLRCM